MTKCAVSINVTPTQRCLTARRHKHVDNRVYSGIYSGMPDLTTLQLTPPIMSLLSEIDEFKGAWRAYGAIAPERLATLRQIATIESIGSSTRIEGSTRSAGAIQVVMVSDFAILLSPCDHSAQFSASRDTHGSYQST